MGGLDLANWSGLQKGGNKGEILVPGKSSESRLYLMITGEVQPAMPMGGQRLAAGDLETIKRWIDAGAKGPAPGEAPATVQQAAVPDIKPRVAPKPQIFSLAYSPDGKWIAAGGFKEIRLIDAASRQVSATLTGHAEAVRSIAFSKDGGLIAGSGGYPGTKGEVKVWDARQRTIVASINGHSDCIYAIAFSPDGKLLATASYDKLVKLWDPRTGAEARTLKDHTDAVYALAFTADGARVISGAADRTVKVWDIATGNRLYTLGEPTDGVNTIAIDPTGRMVAAAGLDKTIRIWRLEEKAAQLLLSQIAHEDAILRLAWSPDGQMLASSSADKSVKVFRASDLRELKSLAPQADWVYGLEFAPDGKTIAAGRYDGSMSIYETERFRDLTEVRTASR
jgi:WD40 repeat protein